MLQTDQVDQSVSWGGVLGGNWARETNPPAPKCVSSYRILLPSDDDHVRD